jgi:hypothetical protein
VGDVKHADLPGPEALEREGKKEGQVIMIKNNGVVEAYAVCSATSTSSWANTQWVSRTGTWKAMGRVVDAVGSKRKQIHDGKEYDYVWDVDIAEGMPPLKLPYNVTGESDFKLVLTRQRIRSLRRTIGQSSTMFRSRISTKSSRLSRRTQKECHWARARRTHMSTRTLARRDTLDRAEPCPVVVDGAVTPSQVRRYECEHETHAKGAGRIQPNRLLRQNLKVFCRSRRRCHS